MIDIDEALPILPRELTDIPDAVRAVGPPQIPRIDAPNAARVANPDTDSEMSSEWMNLPHLAAAS
ncbi:MAG: acetyltransferase, partial [Mycobacterium sp.]